MTGTSGSARNISMGCSKLLYIYIIIYIRIYLFKHVDLPTIAKYDQHAASLVLSDIQVPTRRAFLGKRFSHAVCPNAPSAFGFLTRPNTTKLARVDVRLNHNFACITRYITVHSI